MKAENNEKINKIGQKYQLVPPEGGWGYLVAAALTLAINVTVIPMACFGLIFGNFLASIGDETTGTTLANGIFNTMFNITGLAANHLLQRYSYRLVAFMGACLFFLGSFTTIFVSNLPQMIVSFGVIQGLGMGLMFPAFFTALNCYFDKRLNLVNNVAQSFMVLAGVVFPYFGQYLMVTYGFRGTVAILSALSFNTMLAAITLQPVEWHMKKKLIDNSLQNENEEPLLLEKTEEGVHKTIIAPKARMSIISLGDRAVSVTTINKLGKNESDKKGLWDSIVKSMDLGMFKDLVFVNISLGLALGFTSDVAFLSIIPLVLIGSGFTSKDAALMMSIFFASDLAARILLAIVSALYKLRNRYVVLGGCILSLIFRIAFVLYNGFYWKVVTVAALGFLRCFIQTPLPLVFSDEYGTDFARAFSLYMVVCGVVSLIFGPLMSFVKSWTHSDVMVVHLLSLALLTCIVSWSVELIYKKIRGQRVDKK